jgi:hypothetical protein
MHSPSLTEKAIRYYARKGPPEQALASLEQLIDGIDLWLFVAAIDKAAFQAVYGPGRVDEFLPVHHYEMCVDFILERVVHSLYFSDDAHAQVFAETRNRSEDAQIQMEYQRLQIEGTMFQHPSWFRYQLGPYVTFHTKDDHICGLQLVDILLTAVMAKLRVPTADGLRWGVARRKMYDGGGKHIRGWGLKIFPETPGVYEKILGTS